MGDRTSVELTIFKSDSDLFKQVIGEDDLADFTGNGLHEATIDLKYCDVNFAELGFEESLQKAKIPYIKTWEDGDDYSAGYDVFRVNADGSTSSE